MSEVYLAFHPARSLVRVCWMLSYIYQFLVKERVNNGFGVDGIWAQLIYLTCSH